MKFLCLSLLLCSSLGCQAALTLIKREPFIGPGSLTATAPGTNFSTVSGTLTMVRVGPYISSSDAPGWSADVRTAGPSNFRGTINLPASAASCGMWGAWVRVKSLPPSDGYMSVLQLLDQGNNIVMDFTLNSSGVISFSPLNNGSTVPPLTSPAIRPNTWIWLAVAWQVPSATSFSYSLRCMSMPLGGPLTTWGTAGGLKGVAAMGSVNVGLQTGGLGPMVRVGCPSLYSMAGLSDIAYPSEIIPPLEQSNNWYVNTTTGNDNNDGSTAGTAWRTATKVTTESQYSGMLDSNAAGPGGGDVLNIDTSDGPLVIGTNSLTLATQGLKIQPVTGQTYIRCQAEEPLTKSTFALAPGLSKTYRTTDTQTNITAWQNDEWMWHVKSASYGTAATITNPKTGTSTNYTTTGAALDAVSGSFYTDGTNLYIHPFGDTNPASDGNVYTRSINRSNGLSAVTVTAGNYRALGFYIRKTTLVDSGDNDFGAYCFQDEVLNGSGFSSSVENCYFAYGDKHCFGSTGGISNSSLLVLNTDCEQGNPYCGFGGQSPFVSYTGVTTADNIHTYRSCTCLARSGLIGSTAGDPVGTGGDIILSHNNGSGISFASITLDDCNFASGSATLGVATNLYLTDQTRIGQLNTSCVNTSAQRTIFPQQLIAMSAGAASLVVQNCLIKPAFTLTQAPPYSGFMLSGTVLIEACTFDLSGITGNSAYFQQGIIQRVGSLNLTFRNNAYVVPAGENFPLLDNAVSTDTLIFDHNAYDLGSGTIIARFYGTSGSATDLSFAQWQALGNDCINSTLNANLQLASDIPQSGSPLFNAGVDLGSISDFTGGTFTQRNTIGAYEGSSTYLAPQTIPSFPALQAQSIGATDPLPKTSSAGLTITYQIISGPAKLTGNTLTFSGTGTVVITATQAGDNRTIAPITQTETISVAGANANLAVTDLPTMPWWALTILAGLLGYLAHRSLSQSRADVLS